MKDAVQVYKRLKKAKPVVWTRSSLVSLEALLPRVSNLPLLSNFNVSVSSQNSSYLLQKRYIHCLRYLNRSNSDP